MKITLISSSLGIGGAERVMSIIANYWAARGWQLTILTFDDGSIPPFYDLDKRIEHRSLGINLQSGYNIASLKHNLRQISFLKKAIVDSQPQLVISSVNKINILTLLACWQVKVPTIVCEDVYPAFNGLNKVWQFLQDWTYRRASLITVQTHSALAFFPNHKGYKTTVIPNPVSVPRSEEMASQLYTDDRHLLAIGKLTEQKGFDLLIKAFAEVCDTHPEWTLTILGEGELREELEDLCDRLEVRERIFMPGIVENIDAHLRKADIFTLSSRFEGFPVTLCEAMACGVPVIATDCLSGPREIVHNGVDGMLVVPDNVDALAVGLDLLMSDPVKRQYFSHHAPQVIERFGMEKVMVLWNNAIKLAIEQQSQSVT
jgi:GalNAc-alpha-(1->4)-GalNAc-alpha-(1->3)-diNAcBac-PP-undecaprenol alpha-1,4-N-acetyl-D-galactosaminyltransferase